jgi:opacity protein-like surface antigen
MIARVLAAIGLVAGLCAPAAAQSLVPFQDDFYAGLLLSGLRGDDQASHSGTTGGAYGFALDPTGGAIGVVAGIQLPLVLVDAGAEIDASYVIGARATALQASGGAEDGVTVNAIGHARARVGLPIGPFMPYLAGGLAAASVTRTHAGAAGSGTDSPFLVGASIGAGVDFAVTDSATLRLEAVDDIFPSHRSDWLPALADFTDSRLNLPSVRAGLTLAF